MVKSSKKRMVKGSTRLKSEEDNRPHKYFNLQKVIEQTRLNSDKVYNNFKGLYSSLNDEERKQIATCLMGPTKAMFERLGMSVSFSKLD